MTTPTPRQREVLSFIVESTATAGQAPTLREIRDHMGLQSTNGVDDHLRALIRKGLIEQPALKSRSIRVTDAGLAELGLKRCPSCAGKGCVGT